MDEWDEEEGFDSLESTPKKESGELENKRRRRKPYTRFTNKRRERFLEELRQTGNIRAACEAAFVHHSTAYNEKRSNPEFAVAWDEAVELAVQRMEQEAFRRAVEGYEEPVFGRVAKDTDGRIGTIRKYSDTLLIFLLKARRPTVYRERVDVRHSGSVAQASMDLSKLSDDELADLEAIIQKASAGDDPAFAESG